MIEFGDKFSSIDPLISCCFSSAATGSLSINITLGDLLGRLDTCLLEVEAASWNSNRRYLKISYFSCFRCNVFNLIFCSQTISLLLTFSCVIFAIRTFSAFCSLITVAKLHAKTTPSSSKNERTAPDAANAISSGVIWSCLREEVILIVI